MFEEGDLQYVGVIPVGGTNITNDLAIGLKTDPEVAEKVKISHATAVPRSDAEGISVKDGGEVISFTSTDIDEIVEARLEEIFEAVQKELKKAGKAGQLPSGVVLTGGGAQLKHIAEYAKRTLGLAARVGKATGYGGVAEQAEKPAFATAVGLMLVDAAGVAPANKHTSAHKGKASIKQATGALSWLVDKFKP